MKRTQFWRWGMVAALAALLVVPSLARAQGAIQVTVDSPSGNPTLYNGQTVDIGGWAVDTSAPSGTGVDSVEIFVDVQNGVAAQRIVADYGTRRPDVAQAFGRPDWVNSGFNINTTVQGLSEGEHSFQVWAHTASGRWDYSPFTVSVVAPPPSAQVAPVVQVEVPPPPPNVVIVERGPQPPTVAQPPAPPLIPNYPTVACASTGAIPEPGVVVLAC